ncbi:hypothetical protein IWQ62_002719 [Dispira parvispora]|uniref:MI domain-containing protein n=1 Tax=Dispira parvispora TaxID=1520584 RepID=A0A9W8E2D9_9FUNG|nr:hypothetical protein IWQ62_002719 [Dispira parvispora]
MYSTNEYGDYYPWFVYDPYVPQPQPHPVYHPLPPQPQPYPVYPQQWIHPGGFPTDFSQSVVYPSPAYHHYPYPIDVRYPANLHSMNRIPSSPNQNQHSTPIPPANASYAQTARQPQSRNKAPVPSHPGDNPVHQRNTPIANNASQDHAASKRRTTGAALAGGKPHSENSATSSSAYNSPINTTRPRPVSFSSSTGSSVNGGGTAAKSSARSGVPVQLPSRPLSMSTASIQFGTIHQHAPTPSPPSAVTEGTPIKSGGALPEQVTKVPSVPTFGTLPSSGADKRPPSEGGNMDSSSQTTHAAGRSSAMRPPAHEGKHGKYYHGDGGRGRSASHSNYSNPHYHHNYHHGGPSHYPRGKGNDAKMVTPHPMGGMPTEGPTPPYHMGAPSGATPSSGAPGYPPAHGVMSQHPQMMHGAPNPAGHHQPYYGGYQVPPQHHAPSPGMYPYRGYSTPSRHPGNQTPHKGNMPPNFSSPSSNSTTPGSHGVSTMAPQYSSPHAIPPLHPHSTGSPHMRPRDKPPMVAPTSSTQASTGVATGTSPITGGIAGPMPPSSTAPVSHPPWPAHPSYYPQVPQGQFDPNAPQAYFRPPPPGNMYSYSPQYPMGTPQTAGSPMGMGGVVPPPAMGARLNSQASAFTPQQKVSKAIPIVNPETRKEVNVKKSSSKLDDDETPTSSGSAPLNSSAAGTVSTQVPETTKDEADSVIPKTVVLPVPRPVAIVAPSDAQAEGKPAEDKPVETPVVETVEATTTDVSPKVEETTSTAPPAEVKDVPMDVDTEVAEEEPTRSSDSEPETISVRATDLEQMKVDTPTQPAPVDSKPSSTSADALAESLGQLSLQAEPSPSQKEEAVPTVTPAPQPAKPSAPVSTTTETQGKESTAAVPVPELAPKEPVVEKPAHAAAKVMLDASNLDKVKYPPNVTSPTTEKGTLKYSRDFLLQFQSVCLDKPANLNAEVIAVDDNQSGGRDDSRRSMNSGRRGPSQSRGSGKGSGGFFDQGGMGNFSAPLRTSEERFAAATAQRNMSGGFAGGFPGPIGVGTHIGPRSVSTSHVSRGSGGMGNRDSRGSRRGDKRKPHQYNAPTPPSTEPVKPLVKSDNRWKPMSLSESNKKQGEDDIPSDEVIQRKVKSLLNKLTLEKFTSVGGQIIEFANLSVKTGNGRILELVIQLIFEKAVDEPNFSSVYALLCQHMMTRINDIKDDSMKDAKGNVLSGVPLFRRYLLSRCQIEFETGWRLETEGIDLHDPKFIMSDEYYELQKQKRRGLGLIAFIGELYKKGMLSDRVVHNCVTKLLANFKHPVEEEVESLCKLFSTCGKQIAASPNLSKAMDTYFKPIVAMSTNQELGSRFRCLLLDVIDLRKRNWEERQKKSGPKTIAEIHQDAAREKEAQMQLRKSASSTGRGMPNLQQQLGHRGHGGDRRGMRSMTSGGGDGWSTVGGGAASNASRKAGDLSKFGNLSNAKSTGPTSLGPGGALFGALGSGSRGWKDDATSGRRGGPVSSQQSSGGNTPQLSRSTSHVGTANKFSALANDGSEAKDQAADKSISPVQKSTSTRPRMQLLPRGATAGGSSVGAAAVPTPASATAPKKLSRDELTKSCKSMLREYESIKDLGEVKLCIEEMGGQSATADILDVTFSVALDLGEKFVKTATELFSELLNNQTLTRSQLVEGLSKVSESVDELSMDFPKVYQYLALVLVRTEVTPQELVTILKPLENPEVAIPPALSLLKEWIALQTENADQIKTELQKAQLNVTNYFAEDRRDAATVKRALDMQNIGDYFSVDA